MPCEKSDKETISQLSPDVRKHEKRKSLILLYDKVNESNIHYKTGKMPRK
jgi:hypothetical protein